MLTPRIRRKRRIQFWTMVMVVTLIFATYYVSSSNHTGTELPGVLLEKKKICPALPLVFLTDSSFLPCDWDVNKVFCQHRVSACLACNETSADILFSTVAVGASPQRVFFNDTCLDRVIRARCYDYGLRVPRVLHYVTVNATLFPFFWFVGVLSAVRFFRPCLVLFHGDSLPFGPYWEALLQLVPYVIHVTRDQPTSIFGNEINNTHHRTDILRLEALKKYGGLYLDADEWILQPMDDLRRFPVTLGVEFNGSRICNAMILAEQHASFIKRWYRSYHTFNDSVWVLHSGMMPYKMAQRLVKEVHLEHTFFTPTYRNMTALYEANYAWWNNRGVHLYQRFNTKYFEGRIQDANTSLGEMTRHVLFGSRMACQDKHLAEQPLSDTPS